MRTVCCNACLSCHARPPPSPCMPPSPHMPPVDRMTDACGNITFPELLLRTVTRAVLIKFYISAIFSGCECVYNVVRNVLFRTDLAVQPIRPAVTGHGPIRHPGPRFCTYTQGMYDQFVLLLEAMVLFGTQVFNFVDAENRGFRM